ncbi:bifunctional metallophosphatase/5'-nucleotidase [Neobacillus notoginsengisoli]|uniref:Bifunctional metallophosphatase/5'-nucleotidase n=1 Tax=Neobacillus notoginsengisoli TaxID=1578198 RepID=A0A417YY08_9BACI|nr:bifunctional UDP-sugar hydrolase/5'-nucleotidase [Neobacillus notoginsengisoli]RHW42658.1 bifunctional metallophosphatase/5'-nucleotidase [Neobacillus notoginsengisoli]
METIHIYHTNDLHSHFEHWPRISRLLRERAEEHRKAGEDVFLFDIGDHVDRWHPYTEGTMGKGNTLLLNEAGYTAVTIGNNEGITLPHDGLGTLYNESDFDVLAANLYEKDGTRPEWAQPCKIYKTEAGTNIGVLGLTAPFSLFYKLLGWKLTDPVEELKRHLPALREKADIIVLLSHLGIYEDERIALECPEIDIILGGHTHHILPEGREINKTLLAAAGKYGHYAGHVAIKTENGRIKHKEALLYPIAELSREPWEEAEAASLFEKGKSLLQKKAAEVELLTADYFQNSDLPQLLCEALREWCGAECAFLNAGLILGPLEGTVTKFDLLSVCPHPINPCTVTLEGTELREILRMTVDESLHHLAIMGMGFRGKVMGKFVYDGIEIVENERDFLINGEKIASERKYKVAIPDMYTFGKIFPEIVRSKTKFYYMPEFLRDVLEWKLAKM